DERRAQIGQCPADACFRGSVDEHGAIAGLEQALGEFVFMPADPVREAVFAENGNDLAEPVRVPGQLRNRAELHSLQAIAAVRGQQGRRGRGGGFPTLVGGWQFQTLPQKTPPISFAKDLTWPCRDDTTVPIPARGSAVRRAVQLS